MDKLNCQHLKPEDLDNELVIVRDSIARELGLGNDKFPITIGARCQYCNEIVGGAKKSSHMPLSNSSKKGEALDIGCTDSHLRFQFVSKLLLRGFKRIEISNKHIHYDKALLADGYAQDVIITMWIA